MNITEQQYKAHPLEMWLWFLLDCIEKALNYEDDWTLEQNNARRVFRDDPRVFKAPMNARKAVTAGRACLAGEAEREETYIELSKLHTYTIKSPSGGGVSMGEAGLVFDYHYQSRGQEETCNNLQQLALLYHNAAWLGPSGSGRTPHLDFSSHNLGRINSLLGRCRYAILEATKEGVTGPVEIELDLDDPDQEILLPDFKPFHFKYTANPAEWQKWHFEYISFHWQISGHRAAWLLHEGNPPFPKDEWTTAQRQEKGA